MGYAMYYGGAIEDRGCICTKDNAVRRRRGDTITLQMRR
jgi:hypothetical protein